MNTRDEFTYMMYNNQNSKSFNLKIKIRNRTSQMTLQLLLSGRTRCRAGIVIIGYVEDKLENELILIKVFYFYFWVKLWSK